MGTSSTTRKANRDTRAVRTDHLLGCTSAVPVMANEAGNQRPRGLFTAVRCRCDDPLQRSRRPQDAGIHAEAGILAPEPWTTRLQLRDSAGFAPDFPHFSLTPSDEALCCAFSCERTLPRGSEVVKDARSWRPWPHRAWSTGSRRGKR